MIPVMGKAGQGNGYGGLPGSRKNNIIYIVIKYETPIKLIELYKVGSLLRFEKHGICAPQKREDRLRIRCGY